ncbi:MAG TPA: TadE/TadG family type IV pilus assembly protein [Candidatus Limnocylindria bacterium]|nr:TadE/TadG family type IV pilus assembly protein [Candidatus Limnocylindria bacterium]
MREDRGQAIVEFALVLPVLLVVAFAMVLIAELGIARLALQHATAEAARAGALTNDDEQIRATLASTVAPLPPERVSTAIAPPAEETPRNGDPRGSLLTVRATYEVPVPLGFVGLPRFAVSASASRRIEWTP